MSERARMREVAQKLLDAWALYLRCVGVGSGVVDPLVQEALFHALLRCVQAAQGRPGGSVEALEVLLGTGAVARAREVVETTARRIEACTPSTGYVAGEYVAWAERTANTALALMQLMDGVADVLEETQSTQAEASSPAAGRAGTAGSTRVTSSTSRQAAAAAATWRRVVQQLSDPAVALAVARLVRSSAACSGGLGSGAGEYPQLAHATDAATATASSGSRSIRFSCVSIMGHAAHRTRHLLNYVIYVYSDPALDAARQRHHCSGGAEPWPPDPPAAAAAAARMVAALEGSGLLETLCGALLTLGTLPGPVLYAPTAPAGEVATAVKVAGEARKALWAGLRELSSAFTLLASLFQLILPPETPLERTDQERLLPTPLAVRAARLLMVPSVQRFVGCLLRRTLLSCREGEGEEEGGNDGSCGWGMLDTLEAAQLTAEMQTPSSTVADGGGAPQAVAGNVAGSAGPSEAATIKALLTPALSSWFLLGQLGLLAFATTGDAGQQPAASTSSSGDRVSGGGGHGSRGSARGCGLGASSSRGSSSSSSSAGRSGGSRGSGMLLPIEVLVLTKEAARMLHLFTRRRSRPEQELWKWASPLLLKCRAVFAYSLSRLSLGQVAECWPVTLEGLVWLLASAADQTEGVRRKLATAGGAARLSGGVLEVGATQDDGIWFAPVFKILWVLDKYTATMMASCSADEGASNRDLNCGPLPAAVVVDLCRRLARAGWLRTLDHVLRLLASLPPNINSFIRDIALNLLLTLPPPGAIVLAAGRGGGGGGGGGGADEAARDLSGLLVTLGKLAAQLGRRARTATQAVVRKLASALGRGTCSEDLDGGGSFFIDPTVQHRSVFHSLQCLVCGPSIEWSCNFEALLRGEIDDSSSGGDGSSGGVGLTKSAAAELRGATAFCLRAALADATEHLTAAEAEMVTLTAALSSREAHAAAPASLLEACSVLAGVLSLYVNCVAGILGAPLTVWAIARREVALPDVPLDALLSGCCHTLAAALPLVDETRINDRQISRAMVRALATLASDEELGGQVAAWLQPSRLQRGGGGSGGSAVGNSGGGGGAVGSSGGGGGDAGNNGSGGRSDPANEDAGGVLGSSEGCLAGSLDALEDLMRWQEELEPEVAVLRELRAAAEQTGGGGGGSGGSGASAAEAERTGCGTKDVGGVGESSTVHQVVVAACGVAEFRRVAQQVLECCWEGGLTEQGQAGSLQALLMQSRARKEVGVATDGPEDEVDAAVAPLAVTPPKVCANPQCDNFGGACEAELRPKQCGGCRVLRYCERSCAVQHWREGHKSKCGRLAAESVGARAAEAEA